MSQRSALAAPAVVKRVAEALFGLEARVTRNWAAGAHRRLMRAQWNLAPPPEHFDHRIDLYATWPQDGNPDWLVRGVSSLLCLRSGRLLELSCGDGFNARNFYASRCSSVLGCDIDRVAIRHAEASNDRSNVHFMVHDVREPAPGGPYDNIVWDFAYPIVRYFDQTERATIFENVAAALVENGVFSGYTLAEEDQPGVFDSMADVVAMLRPHFANVKVFEMPAAPRHHFFFWASNGPLPFDADWSRTLADDRRSSVTELPNPDV